MLAGPRVFFVPEKQEFSGASNRPSVQSMQLSYPPSLQRADRNHSRWVRAVTAAVCLLSASSNVAAQAPTRPDFRVVVQALEAYFSTQPDHQAGDLITASQIDAALASVANAGWDVPNASAIVMLGLADNSFLARELSTPAGKKFMRKIARQPGAYPRLDRLSSISSGQAIVRDLIRRPGGDELVTYLATTKGGHNLGESLAATPRGVDLNKPTGRIYTADDLVWALKRAYERAAP